MPSAVRVVLLSLAVVAVVVAGLFVWIRLNNGIRVRDRLLWLAPALLLLMVAFVLIVEWRCSVGWIDPSECHLLD